MLPKFDIESSPTYHAQPDLVPCQLVEFDHLINKRKLEENDDFKDYITPVSKAEVRLSIVCASLVVSSLRHTLYSERRPGRPLPSNSAGGRGFPVGEKRLLPLRQALRRLCR